MSIANLTELQAEWEARKTPTEMVGFLIAAGYAPFRRVSQDQGIVVWVRKVYVRTEHVYPRERYAMGDATVKGGIRYYGDVDDSGVHYDAHATMKKLADFYSTVPEDFVPVLDMAVLPQIAANFVMLVENSVVCDKSGCEERTFLRGLGGMLKR